MLNFEHGFDFVEVFDKLLTPQCHLAPKALPGPTPQCIDPRDSSSACSVFDLSRGENDNGHYTESNLIL